MKPQRYNTRTVLAALLLGSSLPLSQTLASSHMDAPLVTLDPAANTTDVYAFVTSRNLTKYLTVALAVYPHEEPGVGPNRYNFDDRVLYRLHVATGASLPTASVPKPKSAPTATFEFSFRNTTKTRSTIAESFIGQVQSVDDEAQNLTQRYTVRKVGADGKSTPLFIDVAVPPNNQGLVTPLYNQGDDGQNKAKEGVVSNAALDAYTKACVFSNAMGYQVFAGQRDDGFYGDIQSIFDLDFTFAGATKPFDSQGGFNVHTIVLTIPVSELGGDQQIAGVWATTSRRATTVMRSSGASNTGPWVQVGRQGNPLFCEAFVPIVDKDLYNRQPVSSDPARFAKYALSPELAAILGAPTALRTARVDLAGIFIPDVIKVDLSTSPARLAGGTNAGAAPDDAGFHRLSIFGGDTLVSNIQSGFGGGVVPGGWPNGRRFGDDVVDIGVIAVLSDLRTSPPTIFGSATTDIDRVTKNDIGYNKVFPYAATPLNGRNSSHN
ncbi:MAG: DUF4331 domain-containing protein [Verrucomicrobiaceae bacterium]|nr:DUF4331 domain-containing protein [Verrucomicrobiaceae bacterium]